MPSAARQRGVSRHECRTSNALYRGTHTRTSECLLSRLAQGSPITSNQSLLLLPTPTLDLHLGRECFFAARNFLGEHEFQRPSSTGVPGDRAEFMLGKPACQIIGVAAVIRTIRTAQDVNPERHRRRFTAAP